MILHRIASMRIKFPSKHILIREIYLNAEYQRVHANAKITSTCIEIVVKLAFLCLCLNFCAKNVQEKYSTISKAETYIRSDILADKSWDATNLQLSHRHVLPGRITYLPQNC